MHVIAWILYSGFYFMNNAFVSFSGWHKFFYLLNVLVFDLAIFYYLYIVAIPRLLENRRVWLFVLLIVLIILIYPFVKHLTDQLLLDVYPEERSVISQIPTFGQAYLVRALSTVFIVMMAGIGKFTFDWFKNVQIRAELKNQNLTSELAFLKSQINPHFLFNTLNNIHTLAYKKSDQTAESIMKLSDLMRYMIYESNVDMVPLEQEIVHLRSFIDLQELRFKTADIVEFTTSGDQKEKSIAPLLILPLVENAFKHGTELNTKGAIKIHIDCRVEHLKFLVENKFNSRLTPNKDAVGGIGLENIKRRLELIYLDRYTLEVNESSDSFKVQLSILNEKD